MSKFKYPGDIVPRLRKAWHAFYPREHFEVPPLPSDSVIGQLLEVAYHASFTADERRSTQFSLVLCESQEVHEPMVFCQRRPLSVTEVRRLAPAGDIQDLAIGISTFRPTPAIWGLAPGFHGVSPLISVSGPGSVEISRYGRTILSLRGGVIADSASRMAGGHLLEVFREAIDELFNDVDLSLAGNADNPEWLYAKHVETLIRELKGHGHGGSIFIVKDTPAVVDTIAPLVSIKYPCDDNVLWPALSLMARNYFSDASHQEHQVAQRTVEMWPSRIAKLTRVDGATILTDRYRLLGFGAEVTAQAPTLKTIRTSDGTEESIEDYGTRHRSAFRFCAVHPDAVAFVGSQDGDVKCVRSVEGTVTVWK